MGQETKVNGALGVFLTISTSVRRERQPIMSAPTVNAAALSAASATWRADLVAGLAIAGLLLPEAVAYSGIAGLPPQAGVIALFAGLLVYGVLGSSRDRKSVV